MFFLPPFLHTFIPWWTKFSHLEYSRQHFGTKLMINITAHSISITGPRIQLIPFWNLAGPFRLNCAEARNSHSQQIGKNIVNLSRYYLSTPEKSLPPETLTRLPILRAATDFASKSKLTYFSEISKTQATTNYPSQKSQSGPSLIKFPHHHVRCLQHIQFIW